MGKRVNRSEVFHDVSEKTGFTPAEIRTMYSALVDSIIEHSLRGDTVIMNGFGVFYVQKHKGHPISFRSMNGEDVLEDYLVFKFSASHSMNERLRKMHGKFLSE